MSFFGGKSASYGLGNTVLNQINSKRNIHSNYFVAPPNFEERMFGTTNRVDDGSVYVLETNGYNRRATYTLPATVVVTPAVCWATLKA
jgi:hypothetical protein